MKWECEVCHILHFIGIDTSILIGRILMPSKPVKVGGYDRSKPSKPAYEGTGNKPGPKTVDVTEHTRSLPKKK